VEPCDLPAEFGADGPGRAVTRTTLALERAADLAFFQVYGVAPQQVFDGDIANLRGQPVAFDDFRETGRSCRKRRASRQSFRMLVISVPVAEGMAMRTVSMFWRRRCRTKPRRCRAPSPGE